MKVAVIGTTGRLGREAVVRLSKKGIATRCLIRHDCSNVKTPPASLEDAHTKQEVAAYLKSLPGVEFVPGDVTDKESLAKLLDSETTACLALFGPSVPKPFFRALFPVFFPETDSSHPKQINYEGMKHLLSAMDASPKCKRLVRITGKGEQPVSFLCLVAAFYSIALYLQLDPFYCILLTLFLLRVVCCCSWNIDISVVSYYCTAQWSFFSILINAFGAMAKGWNYEAEQVIRQHGSVDYTIIRPGIMKDFVENEDKNIILGLRDNGGDLKVSAVSYGRIADLAIQAFQRDNCKRCTVTAMNVDKEENLDKVQTLEQLQPDSRQFPVSLIAEHKKAARFGGLTIMLVTFLFAKTILSGMVGLFAMLLPS